MWAGRRNRNYISLGSNVHHLSETTRRKLISLSGSTPALLTVVVEPYLFAQRVVGIERHGCAIVQARLFGATNEVRTGLERRVGLGDIARHGGEERDGVLGGGDRVGGGRVDDEAAGLGGRLEVDIVDPDAGAADDPEPAARGLEHLPRDARPAAHHQRVDERDLGAELLRRELVRAVHVRERAQQVQPGGAQLLRDKHRRPPGRRGRRRRHGGPGPGPGVGGRGRGEAEAEVGPAGREGAAGDQGGPGGVGGRGRRRRHGEEVAERRRQGHGLVWRV